MNDVTPGIAPSPSLFAGYQPRAGVFDEMFAASGEMRSHWSALADSLEELGAHELNRRWGQAQANIARDGVTFNPHDADAESARPWVLDAIPMMMTEPEWQVITDGLAQRAQLLEIVLADLYGPQVLLKEKVIPPAVLFGQPGFYPAYFELRPPGHRHLLLYAADLARAPGGEWWVTSDRTRAPFGLGYALENRIIASRMLPKEFRAANVQRMAPFFVELKEALRELAPRFRDNPRIVIWTKGPSSRAYFEDAYLARYLGYTLAQGGDLAVRENRVMLKTLGGLLPIEVLVRRLNDDDCDPVELRPDSPHGVAGLVEAMRADNVSVVNSLGSRLVESPILMAFLPHICRFFLKEELKLPSVATWWCGQPEALQYVLEHLGDLVIRPAFRMADSPPIHPAASKPAEIELLRRELKDRPQDYVAQETVLRSTTPVHVQRQTKPWHLALRAFMLSRGQAHVAMPGGLARVSPQSHVLDFTMTSGERAQDVWVLATHSIDDISLLAPPDRPIPLTRGGSDLPSRVADNLFWLGRYVERAESTLRLVRVLLLSISSETEGGPERRLLLRALAEQGQVDPDYVVSGLEETLPNIAAILPDMVFDPARERSLRRSIDKAAGLASIVRDRIAMDMWGTIRRLSSQVQHTPGDHLGETSEFLDRLDNILAELLAFAGLAAESMTRTQGWRFLDLGRRLERAWQLSMLLNSTINTEEGALPSVLEAILRVGDSLMTYRSRYLSTVQVAPVLDLLVVDDTNPRSIANQLLIIESHVEELPRDSSRALLSQEQRVAVSLRNAVRLADPTELARVEGEGERPALDRLMRRLQDQLPKLSDAVSSRFLTHAGLPRHLASMEGRT